MAGGKKRKNEEEPPMVSVDLIQTKKSHVPEYLRSGEFFKSLGSEEDNDESFGVPGDAMKPDASIGSSEDLIYLLRSLRFWGVDDHAPEIISFVLNNSEMAALKSSLASFEADYPYLHTLRRILRNPVSMRLDVAVEVGDLEMVKYLTHRNVGPVFELTPKTTELAGKHGHVHLLQYLHAQGIAWSPHVFCAVVASGSLECAKYLEVHCDLKAQLMVNFYPLLVTDANIDVYIYGYLHGVPYDNRVLAEVMTLGGLKRLKYFQSEGVPFPVGLTSRCAQYGYMDLLKYLHSQNVPFDDIACHSAAEFNQPKALKFLHENGAPWDETVTECAAIGGNLSCLKYLHEKGCPWHARTITCAVMANSLPCLKYAHEKGCPWDGQAYRDNLQGECLDYLVKHKCPRD